MADDRPTRACYLAEVFTPMCDAAEQRAESEKMRTAAEALAGAGVPVRYLQSVLIPTEETTFFVFEAEQAAVVERILRAAGLQPERISPATRVAGKSAPRPQAGRPRTTVG